MAERRMFAKTIVLSDAFLDMPLTARCLYFTLGMFADDDGFVNSPKGIMRQCGASQDDLNILLAKRFLLAFESGVIVIKHWRINNYLRSDRYKPTVYKEELGTLTVDEDGTYHNGASNVGIPNHGIPSISKDSIDKDSIGKDNTERKAPVEYFPDNIDLDLAFKDYVKMRKTIKAPMTDRAISLAMSKLKKLATVNGAFDEKTAIEILNQSIMNCWKGLFPIGGERQQSQKGGATFKDIWNEDYGWEEKM